MYADIPITQHICQCHSFWFDTRICFRVDSFAVCSEFTEVYLTKFAKYCLFYDDIIVEAIQLTINVIIVFKLKLLVDCRAATLSVMQLRVV